MLNLVLFGPPGAGKGTQAEFLVKEFKLNHISTGDLLRGEIAASTELGLEAKSYMDHGNLVPDEIVIGMIGNLLESNLDATGFIFDGFPRTVAQAEALDALLEDKKLSISGMLSLEVETEELIKRLLNRGLTSGRSDDADESIIANRIENYNEKTAPLKRYYDAQSKLSEIEGMGSIEDIAGRLIAAVKAV